MLASRGMGAINPKKVPKAKAVKMAEGGRVKANPMNPKNAKNPENPENPENPSMKEGGKVNEAGNYTKPGLRKRIFNSIKAAAVQGTGAGQWSARKAQLMAKRYKAAGGGYKD
jgi:hypothetical protein